MSIVNTCTISIWAGLTLISLTIHLTKTSRWSFASATHMSDLGRPNIFVMAEPPTLCVVAGAPARTGDEGSATVRCITCINRVPCDCEVSSLCRPYTDRTVKKVEVSIQKWAYMIFTVYCIPQWAKKLTNLSIMWGGECRKQKMPLRLPWCCFLMLP